MPGQKKQKSCRLFFRSRVAWLPSRGTPTQVGRPPYCPRVEMRRFPLHLPKPEAHARKAVPSHADHDHGYMVPDVAPASGFGHFRPRAA